MFVGSYEHTLDTKGRVSLPAAFRKEFEAQSENLVVMPSPTEKALYVFTVAGFDKWINSLFERDGGFNPRSSKDVAIRKRIMGGSAAVNLDSAGRINVPKNLREYAHLDKAVTVLGNYDHVELWDSVKCEEALTEISDDEFVNFFFTE